MQEADGCEHEESDKLLEAGVWVPLGLEGLQDELCKEDAVSGVVFEEDEEHGDYGNGEVLWSRVAFVGLQRRLTPLRNDLGRGGGGGCREKPI